MYLSVSLPKKKAHETNKQGECEDEDWDASFAFFVECEGIQSVLSLFHGPPVEC